MKTDGLIDSLIKPPRPVYVGVDWSRTDRLKPTGAAEREMIVSERLQPETRE